VTSRQRYGDDPELTRATRSALLHVAVALVVAVLAVVVSFAFVFGKLLFFTHTFAFARGWVLVGIVALVLLLTLRAFRRSSRPARVPADARTVGADEPVAQQLARLSALADVPTPRLVEVGMGAGDRISDRSPGE